MKKINTYLRPTELQSLYDDITERLGLRATMAPHTYDVLELELGVSRTSIIRLESAGFQMESFPSIDPVLAREIQRRRKIYHITREIYKEHYEIPVLMKKYNLSRRTIARHIGIVKHSMTQRFAEAA